jgi:hypothetical protein
MNSIIISKYVEIFQFKNFYKIKASLKQDFHFMLLEQFMLLLRQKDLIINKNSNFIILK